MVTATYDSITISESGHIHNCDLQELQIQLITGTHYRTEFIKTQTVLPVWFFVFKQQCSKYVKQNRKILLSHVRKGKNNIF